MILIIYPSAAEIWLQKNPFENSVYHISAERLKLPEHYTFKCSAALLKDLHDSLGLSYPIYFSAKDPNAKRNDQRCVCRTRMLPFPPDSFVCLSYAEHDIYLATPELCFLQAAHILDFRDLLKFGYELCSNYFVTPANQLINQRTALTSTVQLKDFLNNAAGFYGIKKARTALRYIIDNSNSPMESILAILLFLPEHLGGFHTLKPSLNSFVSLTPEAEKLLGFSTIRPDLIWPSKKVAVEYNSDDYHSSSSARYNDSNRSAALTLSGYKVISFTTNDMKDFNSFENKVNVLRKALKCLNNNSLLEKYRDVRTDLFYHFNSHSPN